MARRGWSNLCSMGGSMHAGYISRYTRCYDEINSGYAMTIDERLEKLAERHEALTQTVDLLAAMHQQNERRLAQGIPRLPRRTGSARCAGCHRRSAPRPSARSG